MGIVLKELGNLEASAAAFKKAISIDTEYYDAYNNIGEPKRLGKLNGRSMRIRRLFLLSPILLRPTIIWAMFFMSKAKLPKQ